MAGAGPAEWAMERGEGAGVATGAKISGAGSAGRERDEDRRNFGE